MIGETLGNYRILSRLGIGGMGAVYLGEHTLIGRKAAIKVLLPEFSHKQEIVERFFNEARAGTAIGHPGIVQIFDFGYHDDDSAYLVMELLVGEALNERLDRLGRLGEDDALRIARQCASALAAAHTAGIIHRDLKPANIFLTTDPEMEAGERAKILDFGIAKLTDSGAAGDLRTRTGSMLGTPAYMSPEQCRGAGLVDHRADIYSLGCVIFRMVCGRPPFVADGVGELIANHLREPPPPLRSFAPAITPGFEAVVQRTLAKQAEARFSSMEELASVLQSLRHGGAAQRAGGLQRPDTVDTPYPPGLLVSAGPAMPAASAAPGMTPGGAPRTAFPTVAPSTGSDFFTAPQAGRPQPPGATPDLTTLGAVASQRMLAVQPRSRRGIAIAGSFVAAGAVVALLVALVGADDPAAVGGAAGAPADAAAELARAVVGAGDTDSPAPATPATRTPEDVGHVSDTQPPEDPGKVSGEPTPDRGQAIPERPPNAPAQPAASATSARPALVVRIESTPPGAAVHVPGARKSLGVTPFEYERPADAEAVTVTLRHKGYQAAKVEIPAGSVEPITVALQKSPSPPARREATRKKGPLDTM